MNKDEMMSWFYGLGMHGIRLGLDTTSELMNRLGNPQNDIKTIHIAGTDGKGSTSAMIESILRESGLKTGLYTSPHILEFNERIRVNGVSIPDDVLEGYVKIVRKHIEDMKSEGIQCTFFEAATAIAFLYFRDVKTDYAVIEVGMGGRFDATNIITPEVSVITNISLEHREYLGDTVEKIAFEKAGIIKKGVPVVTVNKSPAVDVIRKTAEDVGAEVVIPSTVEIISTDRTSTVISYNNEKYTVGLVGEHQARNAVSAIEAVRHINRKITEENIHRGLEKVYWPCRLQWFPEENLIIDVSHTAEGSKVSFETVKKLYGKVTVVFGILGDKDIETIAHNLSAIASKVIVTVPESERAASPDTVIDAVKKYTPDVSFIQNVGDALSEAMKTRNSETVLVTGSLFMAEGAMRWLKRTSVGY